MTFSQRFRRLRTMFLRSGIFLDHPIQAILNFLKAFFLWIRHGLVLAARYVWEGIQDHRIILRKIAIAVAVVVVLVVVLFSGAMMYVDRQIAPMPKPDNFVYLNQGWGTASTSEDRLDYYYRPQGAYVKNIRYAWMVNFERPWKKDRFASAEYMRAYGFIVDPSEANGNPGKLPVGFAPRYDPTYGEMMLDLNCAACHTGELQYVSNGARTSVRIDGGSGHHDFTSTSPGHFAGDLAVTMLATYVNPLKFLRFSGKVLRERDTYVNRSFLWMELGEVLKNTLAQAIRERWLGVYPVNEGYGRTEGLGRILNTAFAVNLDYKNYRVADAPVSYPFVWEIPWFDWVQYMASVRQPFARNVGEAMGTGARYYLKDPFGHPLPTSERFDASLKIANLDHIEHLLRKLRAPCWPEDVFGNIDHVKAAQGKDLFYNKFHCVDCHGPHIAPDFVTAADAPLKLAARNPDPTHPGNVPHWVMKTLAVQDVGTDPTSALNFVNYKLDLTPTGMTADEVRKELTPYYETNYCRQVEYYQNLVTLTANGAEDRPNGKPYFSENEGQQRQQFTMKACHLKAPEESREGFRCPNIPRPVVLKELTPDQGDQFSPALSFDNSCAGLKHLTEIGVDGYLDESLGNIDLSSVDLGHGLNYLITLVRKRSYQDLGIDDKNRSAERELMDGYGQLDTPQAAPVYKARPLAGIWATPPFLHNGSVPTLYDLLGPAYSRPKKFYLKGANYDPRAVGLHADAEEKGAFLFDTTLRGNSNAGHEFRAGHRDYKPGNPPDYGVIGPEMSDDERWAIIEYLKVRRDTDDDPNAGPDPVCPENKYIPEQKEKKP